MNQYGKFEVDTISISSPPEGKFKMKNVVIGVLSVLAVAELAYIIFMKATEESIEDAAINWNFENLKVSNYKSIEKNQF